MENLLDKKTLLKSVLARGRLLLKKQKKGISEADSLHKKPLQGKLGKRLKSKLEPKTLKFEQVEQDLVRANKQLMTKNKRRASAYKVREPKHNVIDRDMRKQRALERLLRE